MVLFFLQLSNSENTCIILNLVTFKSQQLFWHALLIIKLLAEKYISFSQRQNSISAFCHYNVWLEIFPEPTVMSL